MMVLAECPHCDRTVGVGICIGLVVWNEYYYCTRCHGQLPKSSLYDDQLGEGENEGRSTPGVVGDPGFTGQDE
jgi:hypothetical protein